MPRKARGKKVVVRGLLEDKRLVRGPSLVTPSAEDSRALNPERRSKKAPRRVQGQVRGLIEDKMLPRGPAVVTPTEGDSRALNPERTYRKTPRGQQGPQVNPEIEIRREAEEAKARAVKQRIDEVDRAMAQIAEKDLERARGRNTAGKESAAALREKARIDAIAASRAENAESGPDQGPGPMQQADYLPEGLKPRFEPTLAQQFKPSAVTGGLAALAGLGIGKAVDAYRTNRELQDVQFESERERRESVLADLINQSKEQALRESIQANLAEVQRQSPFLYNQVAAGRVLPQGAVVLGGRTRQDLLQELGRSMSEGQFSQ